MTQKLLDTIEVRGYTSIESATVELRSLNVLVGANGAGKSNFVQVLELLGRIVDSDLGFVVGMSGGASSLLRAGDSNEIRLTLQAEPNSYEAVLRAGANDELIFADESIGYHEPRYPEPWKKKLGRGHRETRLHDEVAERGNPSVPSHVVALLEGCRVFHFHDTSSDAPVKQMVSTADNVTLRQDAGNLAAVLLGLSQSDETAYRRIVGAIQQVVPFFRDFVLRPEAGDRIRLRWRQFDSDAVFSANQMSDGTVRYVCLVTLLLSPNLPALVVLDEPELGLHPYAIVQLAGLLQQAASRSQVLIATQSVTLMNQFALDDLIVVERSGGASTFERPAAEHLRSWLEEYSLGELWEKNLLGGRPGNAGTHG